MSASSELVAQVESWLRPLADDSAPCGPDLEYDNAFLELTQAAQGKPESQFEAAVPADWRDVRRRCEQLFEASRDLRVAVLWMRALLRLDGVGSLAPSLRLLNGLMANFWDSLHPRPDPDDGDLYARANVLALLVDPDAVLADLRDANLVSLRGVGEIKVRAVDIALGNITARDDENSWSRAQVEQLFADAIAQGAGLATDIADAQSELAALTTLLGERMDHSQAPDLKPLRQTLAAIAGLLPQAGGASAEAVDVAQVGDMASVGSGSGGQALSGRINSRAEALRAIEMVCDYLERAEPTNPAQLLLRRAGRLLGHNFLQLMKELAPDALSEVARIMGVDPSTVEIDG
ncbi:type VI secretion system protein TssA [Roseateles saccharophilus]|uniref:Type VI secretion system protein ImpA n=1 Tax=Roseateles saccharophilus TaxID=304 RepID=A0A4V2VQX3_ROSSA|nr:type VI secretion system protein TssA [Roseateles saccharophilus]MDG0833110.1 type VI secretion system protein TssA [Roseateles saccharophilus]TCU96309.1 type VI secretion system protein ImpA [Roseateles saccharophilus]